MQPAALSFDDLNEARAASPERVPFRLRVHDEISGYRQWGQIPGDRAPIETLRRRSHDRQKVQIAAGAPIPARKRTEATQAKDLGMSGQLGGDPLSQRRLDRGTIRPDEDGRTR